MIYLERALVFSVQLLAYLVVILVAVLSYVVIGVIWFVFPVYACFILVKALWNKTSVKLGYLLGRGKQER